MLMGWMGNELWHSLFVYLCKNGNFGANPNKFSIFWGLIGQSEQIWHFGGPDGQSKQILVFTMHAWSNLNIFGEIFESLSVHKTGIFGNFHLASPPIIGGPTKARDWKTLLYLEENAVLYIIFHCEYTPGSSEFNRGLNVKFQGKGKFVVEHVK